MVKTTRKSPKVTSFIRPVDLMKASESLLLLMGMDGLISKKDIEIVRKKIYGKSKKDNIS